MTARGFRCAASLALMLSGMNVASTTEASAKVASRTLPAQTSPGVVGEVRVHGNHTTPDADVLAIVGDVVGKPATDALVAEVTARIEKSGRFEGVDVRKRFRSIDNPDDILLMVVVDEVPGISADDLTPGPWKTLKSSGMFLPIVHHDDGYGFTYGARMSFVDRLGPRSRVSFPLTWGGERQARAQLERSFTGGPIARLSGEAGIGRRENPHFAIGDTRTSGQVRAESAVRRWLRLGAGAGLDQVKFGEARDRLVRAGGDVTLDTRVDPAFPRNAVHATFGIERLSFDAGTANRRTADVRGYVGLLGQSVLAVRAMSLTSTAPLPDYEKGLLGGAASVRGYDAGYRADDNLAVVSAELRVPVTAPLSIGRFGVKAFVDAGTAYAHGAKLSDQALDRGYGGGAYLHLTILSLSLDVARGHGTGDVRWHFGMGVTFK
ncbi:MAG: BamA/TamA family outer membrane protein [Vicinamibacterales bacterium]|jgi:outer membrane protein assembly factor BamA